MNDIPTFELCEECGRPTCASGCLRYGTWGCRRSLYELGKVLMDEQEYVLAITYLERAADRSVPDAYRLIGDCYRLGDGVAVDCEKARQYYRLASCKRSIYEPLLAEAGRTKVIKSVVRPIRRIGLEDVADCKDETQLRYLEVNESVCPVEDWSECLTEIVRFVGMQDPEGLLDFALRTNGGMMRVSKLKSRSAISEYQIRISGEISASVARHCIVDLFARFDWLSKCGGLWIVIEPIVIPLRMRSKENLPTQGKGVQTYVSSNGRQTKNVCCRSGGSCGRSSSSFSASAKRSEKRETYAQKGIGYLARDNGRFGSLPLYDNMDG